MGKAKISEMSSVHPSAQIHESVIIGPFCRVGPNVVLEEGVILESHVIVGGIPEHVDHLTRAYDSSGCSVIIGKNCWLKEGVTVHVGIAGDTVVSDNCVIMQKAHVAHDCFIGEGAIISGQANLCGHVHVGKKAFIGANSTVHQFVHVGAFAMVGANVFLRRHLPPGSMATCAPPQVIGLNEVGLARNNVSKEQLSEELKAWTLATQTSATRKF